MLHSLLVAVDRSRLSQHVFEEALALAKATSASLVLLNVLSPEDEESPSTPTLSGNDFYPGSLDRSVIEIYQDLWDSYAKRGMERLRSLAEQAKTAGVKTTFHQGLGSPGRIICELARELNVDLIVLGRRGRSGLNELILGSVSNYVLHHAHCSVFTVQCAPQAELEVAQPKHTAMTS
jgi:nucleotide-binding universal stress UspA family protein